MNFQNSTSLIQERIRRAVGPDRSRRTAIIVGAILVAIIGGLYGFELFREYKVKSYLASNRPPPAPVTYETVTPVSFPQRLTAVGSISAVHQVAIAPEVDGSVTRILFQPGVTVKKGDVLVQLNDGPERGELNAMRAQQRLAKVALDRQQSLIQSGFVSRAQLDQAQSQYDAASANISRLEAVVAQKQLRAPFDGDLGVRQAEVGQYLKAGDTVTWITQSSPLYVTFTLPEQAHPRLEVGQDVNFTVDAHPERTFTARIAVIDPQVMAETRSVKVQAVAENPDRALVSGMFANVQVILPPRPNTLTVPETAIDFTIGGQSVYVIREEMDPATNENVFKVHRTAIEAGERQGNRVVVTGVKAGDKVVAAGQIRLFEGATVKLGAQETPPTPSPNSLN